MLAWCRNVWTRSGPALAVGLSTLAARADDRAARVLDAVRAAYRANTVDELITIELRGQGALADVSEGRLRLRLDAAESAVAPSGDVPTASSPDASDAETGGPFLDLVVGPVRTFATATGITVLHATDPERFVGRAIDALTLGELERVIPSIPLPQVALAIGDSSGDTLHIPSILPRLTLHEIARGQTTITLTGRDGPVAATLVVARDTHRVQRFEATVPAASGWYDLIVTVEPVAEDDPAAGVLPPEAPDTTGRQQVARVADLRPRGLVLVPDADLAWLPIQAGLARGVDAHPDRGGDAATLGTMLAAPGPMAVAFLELPAVDPGGDPRAPLDPAWLDQVRQTVLALDAARGDCWSLILVFDPSARRSVSMDRIEAALAAADIETPWAWVDGRTVALDRALPRIGSAMAALSGEGTILDIGPIPEDEASRADFTTRLRHVLAGDP